MDSGYSALEFGSVYLYRTQGPTTSTSTCTPSLLVGSIHQHSLPAEGLPVLAQPRSKRVSTYRPIQQIHDT